MRTGRSGTVGFDVFSDAIVAARGVHLERPLQSALNILVPVTGTEASRRAAEIGIAIAQAAGAPVTALYVSTGRSKRAAGTLRNALRSRRQHEAILRDAVEMADRYNVDIRTDVKVDVAADDAILRQANANTTYLAEIVERTSRSNERVAEIAERIDARLRRQFPDIDNDLH